MPNIESYNMFKMNKQYLIFNYNMKQFNLLENIIITR